MCQLKFSSYKPVDDSSSCDTELITQQHNLLYVCMCVCVCIYVCVCVYIYINICVCVCIYIYMCVFIYIYVCICLCVYVYVSVCVCVCMCMCLLCPFRESGAVGPRCSLLSNLRILLVLEVLVDGGVEVFGVALVQTVDLSPRLHLHVLLRQDELADGLQEYIDVVLGICGNASQTLLHKK